MPPRRTLGQRDLNRAMLARQGLLVPHEADVPIALERVGGIQAQYAPSTYVGLWSRTAGLRRDDVTRSLEDRTSVQATLLRGTIHVVSRADYWPWALAIRASRREWHLRAIRHDPPEAAWRAAAERLRTALADGPMHRRAVDALVGPGIRSGIGVWLDLVRVPPSGTWEHRPADLFTLAEDWVGPPTGTADDGVDLLVRRYLEGFGPARPADVASWAGLPVRTVTAALDRADPVTYAAEAGKELFDLAGGPLPDGGTPAPVRFLPTWDATLLVHARRTLVLPEEHRPVIFSTKRPHSIGTYLVDGQVAGTWRPEPDGTVVTAELTPLRPADRRAVAAEAERLTGFHRDGRG